MGLLNQGLIQKKQAQAAETEKLLKEFVRNGGSIQQAASQKVRKSQQTFPVSKSKYSVWAQGVTNFVHGRRGVSGTVEGFDNGN